MDILATADWHLGKKTHGKRDTDTGLNDRLLDVRDRVLEIAEASHAHDLVLFAGDAYEHPNPTPTQQRLLTDALKQFEAPVIMIPGNHDHPVTEGRSHAIDGLRELNRVTVIDRPSNWLVGKYDSGGFSLIRIDDESESESLADFDWNEAFILCALPWPLEQFVSDEDEDALWNKYTTVINLAEQYAVEHDTSAIGMGHITAQGSLPSGSESKLQMGDELLFDPNVFSGLEFTALGHVHKHQHVGDSTVYVSSPERLSFSEEDDQKGYVSYDTENNNWQFIKTNAREFNTIECEGHPEDCVSGRDLRDQIVRVHHQNEKPMEDNDIFQALKSTGAHHVAEIKNTIDLSRSQTEDIPDYDEMDTSDMLREYGEQKDMSDERVQLMIDKLAEL